MEIQVGKKYVNRDGDVVEIVRNDGTSIPWKDSNHNWYYQDGAVEVDLESPEDLVSEYNQKLQGELKDQKLYFDTKGKPGLAGAICARLSQLGIEAMTSGGWASNVNNVTLGLAGGVGYNQGCLAITASMYAGYRLTTLEDLYNIDSWLEPEPEPEVPNYAGRYLIGDNRELNEATQRRLFELGVSWSGTTRIMNESAQVLWVSDEGYLSWCEDPEYKSDHNDNTPRTLLDLY